MQPAKMPPADPDLMTPMLPSENERQLEDLAFNLIRKASSLAGQIHPIVASAIGNLVRSMNCYYSNLIEGHETHPRDIDRALHEDYSAEPKRRVLQLEAVAHIEVQHAIDNGCDDPAYPASATYAIWLHREFCRRLPEELMWIDDPFSSRLVRLDPGVLRDGNVVVGNHLAPAAESVSSFLKRFDQAYDPENLSKVRQIVASAAAHHRLLWIHPFFDGNGRVARLMSHAMFKRLGIGSSLWSVARGLARNASRYKSLLMAADEHTTENDGHGSLSQQALNEFCHFFLAVCVDQVDFMHKLLEPLEALRRIEIYTEEEIRANRLPKGSFPLLREAFLAGEFERGQAPSLTGYRERMARMVLSRLLESDLLESASPKARVRLGFPLGVVERWFPALYPG